MLQSYKLLENIHRVDEYSWGVAFFLAWVLGLFVTGIFAFAGFAFPTQRLLPDSYYKIWFPERLDMVCRVLGVEVFRKMLLLTLWRNKKQRRGYFDGKRTGISVLEVQSKKSEFGHLLPFVLILAIGLYFFIIGLQRLAAFTLLINIAGNFYPILLQRHHRMRIQALRERLEGRVGREVKTT